MHIPNCLEKKWYFRQKKVAQLVFWGLVASIIAIIVALRDPLWIPLNVLFVYAASGGFIYQVATAPWRIGNLSKEMEKEVRRLTVFRYIMAAICAAAIYGLYKAGPISLLLVYIALVNAFAAVLTYLWIRNQMQAN